MDFKNIDEGHLENTEGDEQFLFFYNREERIAKAPKIVQDFYNGKGVPQKKGLLKTLISTKQNKFLFSSIIIFCFFIFILNYFSTQNESKIAGTSAELTVFSYEDEIYSSLKLNSFSEKEKSKYQNKDSIQIPVIAKFTAYEESGIVCDEKIIQEIFTGDELFIRTKFTNYDIIKVSCQITMEDETKTFLATLEKH